MAGQFTIQQILTYQKISQYLAGNDKSSQLGLKSGSFIGNLEGLLYMEGYLLQNLYTLNPSSSTLRSTGEYVLSLCGKYLQQAIAIANGVIAGAPVITGPSNISVNVGANATFSVTITGISPFGFQWFDYLGNPIPGATSSSYTFLNSQLSDSGKTFFVKVTDANGQSTTSSTATLTVTAAITGFFAYMDADPGPDLQANLDPFTYPVSFTITHNQPISILLPSASTPNKFLIAKIPIGESIKTAWNNTPLNNGTIPDFNWQTLLQFGGFTYYYSRQALSMDTSQPLILS